MDLIDTRMHSYSSMRDEESEQCCEHSIIKPACVPITILSLVVLTIVFYPLLNEEILGHSIQRYERTGQCSDQCSVKIVESIPTNLSYTNFTENLSTYDAWKSLLDGAKESIDFAVFYWDLRDSTNYSTSWQGRSIFEKMVSVGKRGVKLRIAQNSPTKQFSQDDSRYLANEAHASVRSLDFNQLLGGGVLHTKFWIVDEKHVYIGSANMDWKSLTEVKELGYLISNCSCIASDLAKVFTIYWRLGVPGSKVPEKWPLNLRTYFNFSHPLNVVVNSKEAQTFLSSSPGGFNSKGRQHDVDAIVEILKDARHFAHIAVMDYLPTTEFLGKNNHYWPLIDDALREAAYNGATVRLLISKWNHSRDAIIPFLKSLTAITEAVARRSNGTGRIEAKIFVVPSDEKQAKISYARVNHNKYMVTDRVAYVGTSNWVGDYFINTAGVGVSFMSQDVIDMLNGVFLRDWNSAYAKYV